jgi:SAM-dependent methyltransferase
MNDDYKSIHEIRFKIILNEIRKINIPHGSPVLDIGCYPPYLFDILSKPPFSFRVYGIASKHEKMKRGNIAILNIEEERFPFKDNSFDLILFSEVMEHLLGSPSVYLSEIKRVLKPRGFLVLTTPNASHLKNRTKILLGRSPSFPVSELYETDFNRFQLTPTGFNRLYFRHNREFTKKELEQILTREGLRMVKSSYVSFYTPGRKSIQKKPLIQKLLSYGGNVITKCIPQVRDSLLFVATK